MATFLYTLRPIEDFSGVVAALDAYDCRSAQYLKLNDRIIARIGLDDCSKLIEIEDHIFLPRTYGSEKDFICIFHASLKMDEDYGRRDDWLAFFPSLDLQKATLDGAKPQNMSAEQQRKYDAIISRLAPLQELHSLIQGEITRLMELDRQTLEWTEKYTQALQLVGTDK